MHLALVIPTLDAIGGAESQVLLLSKGLARRGWRVTLVTLSGSEAADAEKKQRKPYASALSRLESDGVSSLCLGMRKSWVDPRGWSRYVDWAAKNSPDIVHAHLPQAFHFARCARLLCPVRAVVETIHTTHRMRSSDWVATRLSNWLSDRTTCVSEAVAESVVRSSAIAVSRLSILGNGIVLEPMQSRRWKKRDGKDSEDAFRWLAVGRLAPVKDYPTLLSAFAALSQWARADGRAAPRLTIAGAGPEDASLRQLADHLGLADQVDFVGFQCSMQPLLAAADAFVLSSLWEGLPIGLLEAQAACLPVVATDGPGTAQAMRDGGSGFLVAVGNSAQLSMAMARMMALPDQERQRMGNVGWRFVEEHFSLETILEQWENLYLELLDSRPLRARRARESIRPGTGGIVSTAEVAPTGISPQGTLRLGVPGSAILRVRDRSK